MVCHPSHSVVLECFYCVAELCSPVYTLKPIEDYRQYGCLVDFGLKEVLVICELLIAAMSSA